MVEQYAATRSQVRLRLLDDDHQLMESLPGMWNEIAAVPGADVRLRLVAGAVAILVAIATGSGSSVALAWKPGPEKICDVLRSSAQRSQMLPWFSPGGLCDPGVERRSSLAPSAAVQPQLPEAAGLQLRIGVARVGGGHAVTTVPLETYVARVLAGEAGRDSQPAALEALAIAVRTYALANRGRHRADGFDLCDETHCQVMRTATAATEHAAAATAGRVLVVGGAPASIYYSASCGGRTEIPSEVWPGADDPPYLPSQPDDGCGGAPMWSAELSNGDLLHALRAAGFTGSRLREMRIASRNASGRVARLRLDGLTPEWISGQDLRAVVGRTVGWQFIKSTAFTLERRGDRYRFDGHGSGHGVGLCVIGSMRLAVAGQSADEILHRYYPGLTIGRPLAAPTPPSVEVARSPARSAPAAPTPPAIGIVSPPPAAAPAPAPAPAPTPAPTPAPPPMVSDVLVSLPDGDEGERAFITEAAVRARTDLVARARCPGSARDPAVPSNHGELRAGDGGTVVHLGRHCQRRDSSAAAGCLARARRARTDPASRVGPRDDECRAGGASVMGPRGRRAVFRGRTGDSGSHRDAARRGAAELVSRRCRAAPTGLCRRAEQRLCARPVVLCP